MRADSLVDAGSTGDTHDPRCAVSIQTRAVATHEDRPFGSFTDDQIDSPRERDGDLLAAFAVHQQCAVTAFEP